MRELLKATYNFSDYQIAQLVFLAKTLLSEISKVIFIGIFFTDDLLFYLTCILILSLLRTSTGGLHCKTYFSCLIASCLYIVITLKCLPLIYIGQLPSLVLLAFCFITDFIIGPVTSDVHLPLSKNAKMRGRICTGITITIIFFFMHMNPQNRYVITGFWITISHTLQLIVAKIKKKGVE